MTRGHSPVTRGGRVAAGFAAAVCLAVVPTACRDGATNDQARAVVEATPTIAVEIRAVAGGFEPSSVTVAAGEAVRFVNDDDRDRRFAAVDQRGPQAFDSGLQRPGERFVVRFVEAGTVPFRDLLVNGAEGTITVIEPPTAAG